MKAQYAMQAKLNKAVDVNNYILEVLNQEHITYVPGVLDGFKKPMFIGGIHSHYIAMSLNEGGKNIRCIDLQRMNLHQLHYKLIVVETEGNFDGFDIVPNAIHTGTPDAFRRERYQDKVGGNLDLVFWMVSNKPDVKVFDISEVIERHLKFMKTGKGESFLKV